MIVDQLKHEKKVWRRELKARRRAYMRAHPLASLFTEKHILSALGRAEEVAFFWPLPGEPDLRFMPQHHSNYKWSLPVITNGVLVFRRFLGQNHLAQNTLGVCEPVGGKIVTPDHVLVPLLGVDECGVRLGFGGGFYDRTFARFKPTLIGVCFATQVVLKLPAAAHDVRVDMVATDCFLRVF